MLNQNLDLARNKMEQTLSFVDSELSKIIIGDPTVEGVRMGSLAGKEQLTEVTEKVKQLVGVPTVWLELLNYTEKNNITLDTLETVLVGGSAAPKSMIKAFQEKHNAFMNHGWGMTEMSPLGTATSRTKEMEDMDIERRYDLQQKQGKAFFHIGCSGHEAAQLAAANNMICLLYTSPSPRD